LAASHAGSLTLSGPNTYSGGTEVNGGTLLVNNTSGSGTGTGAVTVGSGGRLGGTGSIDGAVTDSGKLIPGGTSNAATFTLNGGLTLTTGASLDYELSSLAQDKIAVSGNLNLSGATAGSIVVNVADLGGTTSGTYPLLTYSGSLSGNTNAFTLGSAPAGYSLVSSAGALSLQVVLTTQNLTWTGAASGSWQVGGPVNWTGGTSNTFANGDTVNFTDAATGTTTITVAAGGVQPAAMNFNNSSKDYTIGGGAIGGTGGLSKSGTGKVTLTGNNTFTGGVLLNAGTLAIASGGAIGATSGVTIENNAVLQAAGTVSSDRNITIGTGGGTIDSNGNSITLTGAVSGANVLTKAGAGTLNLAAANPGLTAGVTVNGGTLKLSAVDANGVTGAGTGTVTVNSGGTLEIANIAAGAVAPGTAFAATFMNGSTFRGTGTAFTRGSGTPAIDTAAGAQVTFDVPGASDVLLIGNSVRNAGGNGQTSGATVTVTGAGRLHLASGGTSASANGSSYNGSWVLNMDNATGILQLGPIENGGFGEPLNALGYVYGSPNGAGMPIDIKSGTLALGADSPNQRPTAKIVANSFRSPMTLDGGKIASSGFRYTDLANPSDPTSTTPVTANVAGDLIMAAGKTSTVLLYDPVLGTAGGSRSLNVMTDPNATGVNGNLTWQAGATLVVDPSTTTGGALNFSRTTGAVSVAAAGATLQVNSGATVNLGGTQDVLSDSIIGGNYVNVANNGALNVTAGTKNAGNISGTGTTTVNATTTLNASSIRQGTLQVNGAAVVRPNDGTAIGRQNSASKAQLNIAAGSSLDLTNNSMVVVNNTDSAVRGLITGNLLTTTAAAPAGKTVGLGYAQGNDATVAGLGGLLAGQSFGATDVAVKFTYLGDADLDGDVDGVDVGKWATNFTGSGGSTSKVWTQGDWDYDGDVDGVDVGKWATNFTGSGGGVLDLPGAQPAAVKILDSMGFTVVPEPGSIGLLLTAACGLATRRRRRMTTTTA
jgi:autotransporter-associated beta strand protein